MPPLGKEREPNQPIITSFVMKTPVEPKGKSEEHAAVKNTKAKLAASQERAQVEKVLQADPSLTEATEEEDEEELIPLSFRTTPKPQNNKKKMVPKKSTRSAVSAANPKATPQPISPGLNQAKQTSSQKACETREEAMEAEKKGKLKKEVTHSLRNKI